MDDYVFDKSVFYSFSSSSSVILDSLSRSCFTLIKSIFFTSISKSVITYITFTVTNISNTITKQNFGIIKTFKVLVIVNKKQFSRNNILLLDGLTFLNVKGDIPICSFNFQVSIHLTVTGEIAFSTYIFIYHSRH